jgi:hypothetical protein
MFHLSSLASLSNFDSYIKQSKLLAANSPKNRKSLLKKQVLVRELEAIVKEKEEIGPGTGVERAIRWTGRNPAAGGRGGNVNGKVAAVPAA